jgi:thiamine pyrophosphokinase
MHSRIYIFLNGDFSRPNSFPKEPGEALVIAVDRGVNHVLSLGWPVHVLLGDFDSIDKDVFEMVAANEETQVLTFPVKKDKTDFELALELAADEIEEKGAIYVLAAFGGDRLDMTFANLFMPAAGIRPLAEKRPRVFFLDGECLASVITGPDVFILPFDKTGSIVSLIPLFPEAKGVTLEGRFKYPLRKGRLRFGRTLGLSNEYHGGAGSIALEEGVLAVFIHPLPKAEVTDPEPDMIAPPENFPELD